MLFRYRTSSLNRSLPPIVRYLCRWSQVRRFLELLERRSLKIPVLTRISLRSRGSCLHVGWSSSRVQKRRFVSHQKTFCAFLLMNLIFSCRSCKWIFMPRCWRNRQRWIILTTCSPRRLQKILYLPWRCCPRIWMPNWNSLQDRRLRRFRKLWRSRRCSRMVSFRSKFNSSSSIQKPHEHKKSAKLLLITTLKIAMIHRCLITFITFPISHLKSQTQFSPANQNHPNTAQTYSRFNSPFLTTFFLFLFCF